MENEKKNYVIYIYKLFFEINPNTLSTGGWGGDGGGCCSWRLQLT